MVYDQCACAFGIGQCVTREISQHRGFVEDDGVGWAFGVAPHQFWPRVNCPLDAGATVLQVQPQRATATDTADPHGVVRASAGDGRNTARRIAGYSHQKISHVNIDNILTELHREIHTAGTRRRYADLGYAGDAWGGYKSRIHALRLVSGRVLQEGSWHVNLIFGAVG